MEEEDVMEVVEATGCQEDEEIAWTEEIETTVEAVDFQAVVIEVLVEVVAVMMTGSRDVPLNVTKVEEEVALEEVALEEVVTVAAAKMLNQTGVGIRRQVDPEEVAASEVTEAFPVLVLVADLEAQALGEKWHLSLRDLDLS